MRTRGHSPASRRGGGAGKAGNERADLVILNVVLALIDWSRHESWLILRGAGRRSASASTT